MAYGVSRADAAASASGGQGMSMAPLADYPVRLMDGRGRMLGETVFARAGDARVHGDVTGILFWARLRRGALENKVLPAGARHGCAVLAVETVPLSASGGLAAFPMTLLEADSVEAVDARFGRDGLGGLWLLAPDCGDGARSCRASGDASSAGAAAPPLLLTLVRATDEEFERSVRDPTANPLRADAYAAHEHALCMQE